ncbi:MAG: hypothetical protein Q6352_002130 [Candidatus Freyrarchaeum guaymaensis]
MDEVEQLVRTIFFTHGSTRKIPLDEEEQWNYDYNEDHIAQRLLYRHELREQIMRKGYTREQAEKMISECWLRGIIDEVSTDPRPCKNDRDRFIMANEEYWVEREGDFLLNYVFDDIRNSEVRKYVLDYPLHEDDVHEKRIREVYHEHNQKVLSRKTLIRGLLRKGYTWKQAKNLIEKYTAFETSEEEKKNRDEADRIFKRPEYKPLKHHKLYRIFKSTGRKKGPPGFEEEEFTYTEIPDSFEMMQREEWELEENGEVKLPWNKQETHPRNQKDSIQKNQKNLEGSRKKGRKTLTKKELKQKIIAECNATEEEAEKAIHAAEATFKIRAVTPALQEIWNLEPYEGVEYYWSGTTLEYPPFTLQDRIFNPIKRILTEAEKEGKKWLTRGELVEKAYEYFKEHKFGYRATPRTITKEFVEDLIEDAEELLLITSKQHNGKVLYQLNHQIASL